jgi:hypothetical protein
MLTRRHFLVASAAALVARRNLFAESAPTAITVYKDAGCDCCARWVTHLEKNGFAVTAHNVADVDEIKQSLQVPGNLQSCHTAVVGKYVIEGHVPADVIKKLLAEKPAVRGLAAPGMPMGSPGMEMGGKVDHYDIMAFAAGKPPRVFARR